MLKAARRDACCKAVGNSRRPARWCCKMCGGVGMGPVEEVFESIFGVTTPGSIWWWSAGRNEKLKQRLENIQCRRSSGPTLLVIPTK